MSSQKGFAQFIVLILIIVGIAVTVFLVQRYTNLFSKASEPSQASESDQASLSVSPENITLGKDCTANLNVNLDTGGNNTAGVDANLLFDPAVITIVSVKKGTLYPTYPAETFDNTAGKVQISGISSLSQPFKGEGVLARITFKINPQSNVSSSQIKFDFDPANPKKTNDSNIVQSENITDVLSRVTNATISIDPTQNCSPSTSLPSPSDSLPTLTATLSSAKDSKRAILNVSWNNVLNSQINDRLLITNPARQKDGTTWVYAATCTQNLTTDVQSKSQGNCPVVVLDNGTYQASYYQEIAKSSPIDFNK